MSGIFQHAMRYESVERNPLKLVRRSAKREKVPEVLERLFSMPQLDFGSASRLFFAGATSILRI
jgi:hypothetical protein